MHETRNLILIVLLILCSLWAMAAWVVLADPFGAAGAGVWLQRIIATGAAAALGLRVWHALAREDKLPDHLRSAVGPLYHEADGLSFMPVVRVREDGQAELLLYYQNRFENYGLAIIYLRLPEGVSLTRPAARTILIGLKADGGDFGVLHQPIGVPRELKGQVIEVEVAASSRFPRAHGSPLRRQGGAPCGTILVDWQGEALRRHDAEGAGVPFRVGVYAAGDGEQEVAGATTLRLGMPGEAPEHPAQEVWKQEVVEPGPPELRVLG